MWLHNTRESDPPRGLDYNYGQQCALNKFDILQRFKHLVKV